jgi:hypothetical protein
MSTEQWTPADDRALAEHAAWDQHVRTALHQSRQRDRLDEMVDADAAAMTEAHARAADAVHRRDGVGLVLTALLSLAAIGVLVGVVVAAVTL